MFSFIKNGNSVSLCENGKEILSNMNVWINSNVAKTNWKHEIIAEPEVKLELVNAEDDIAYFECKGNAKIVLSLSEENGCFAIKATGKYKPSSSTYGSHIDICNGIHIDFNMPHTGNFVSGYIRYVFWQEPFIGKELTSLKPRTQALLLQNDKYEYFLTAADKAFKSELFSANEGNRVSLMIHANAILDEIDEFVLFGGTSEEQYLLEENVTSLGFKKMNKNGMLRKDKKYPEAFEYLGWCSWDAFHQEVSEDKLVEKAQEFKDKEIPVRWIILDDMWGDVPCVCRENMGWRDLNDWEADPKRFPNGLKGAVKRIKDNYGLKVGIWHPINGYWLGIDPNGTLAKKHGDLLEYTIPIDGNTDTHCNYMHSFDKEKIEKYYDLQHAFYKDCGIDFTKIDNQGSMERFSHRKMPVSKAAKNLHTAIENAAAKYYDGSLINCMGMTIENFWNRSYSTVNRVSNDFLPEDRKWFICHILQCSYNCLTQGTAYTGDWDMWWSDDDQAKKNAVLRSMSGGPIYMSDELNRSIKEVIMPTVLSDGRILRLKNPALPTADCMFADCEHDSVAFKLFNTIGNCGVLATFNLDENENEVSCTASSRDINGLADGDYVVYNWFEKTAQLLKKGEKLEYTLKNYDDFRLLLFVPVINGKAVIGLMEKYMAPAAVTVSDDDVCALDDGTLVVYSQNALEGWDKLEGNLYIKNVKKNEKIKV